MDAGDHDDRAGIGELRLRRGVRDDLLRIVAAQRDQRRRHHVEGEEAVRGGDVRLDRVERARARVRAPVNRAAPVVAPRLRADDARGVLKQRPRERGLQRQPLRVAVVLEEVLDDVPNIDLGSLIETEGANVFRDVLEDVVADPFGQSVPRDDVAERLPLEIRRAGGVDDGQHVRVRGEVVDGLADLLQLRLERLSVGVMSLVREDSDVR